MSNNPNAFVSKAYSGLSMKRSKFNRGHSLSTTYNTGDLVPLYWDEVMAGDTIDMRDTRAVVRMATPIAPVMDSLYQNIYAFFVPNRLLWEHWKNFCGEVPGAGLPQRQYTVPQLSVLNTLPTNCVSHGCLGDYMGLPPVEFSAVSQNTPVGYSVSALPFRAYAMIWNEWFRDENLQNLTPFYTDDVTRSFQNSGDPILGGKLLKVGKIHDYFTSALPYQQKGNPVSVGLLGFSPLVTNGKELVSVGGTQPLFNIERNSGSSAVVDLIGTASGDATLPPNTYELTTRDNSTIPPHTRRITMTNLGVDLGDVSGITINELRLAFQTQRFLERSARCGSRYIEYLRAHFGVVSSDARLQRPEYLGGFSQPVNIQQIVQTSSSTEVSPLGDTGAWSLTPFSGNLGVHSFEEPGILMVLGAVKVNESYCQGLLPKFNRVNLYDYYHPVFANIGEQSIKNKEIFLPRQGMSGNTVFGYKEAWAEYRYGFNEITGRMRPKDFADTSDYQSFDIWNFANNFDALPVLNEGFISQGSEFVQRTLAVDQKDSDQFIANFYFGFKWTRVMPAYSVPGLIDHH